VYADPLLRYRVVTLRRKPKQRAGRWGPRRDDRHKSNNGGAGFSVETFQKHHGQKITTRNSGRQRVERIAARRMPQFDVATFKARTKARRGDRRGEELPRGRIFKKFPERGDSSTARSQPLLGIMVYCVTDLGGEKARASRTGWTFATRSDRTAPRRRCLRHDSQGSLWWSARAQQPWQRALARRLVYDQRCWPRRTTEGTGPAAIVRKSSAPQIEQQDWNNRVKSSAM